MMVQWLRLDDPNAEGAIPGQGTKLIHAAWLKTLS